MARYFLFPEKDATIYAHPNRVLQNTGLDEILTITSEQSSDRADYFYPSRYLIQFKQDELVEATSLTTGTYSASLQIFTTENKNLAASQTIEVLAIANNEGGTTQVLDWDNGTGRYLNTPKTQDGVSWKNITPTTEWATSSFSLGITGSYGSGSAGGGNWFSGTQLIQSQSFTLVDNLDLDVNVTSTVFRWVSSGVANSGFLLKRSGSDFTTTNQGELNYFSLETHTIFPPALVISWDDSTYSVDPSGSIYTGGESLFTEIYNNKAEYKRDEVAQFRVLVRERYPERRFVTTSNYLNKGYFEEGTLTYSVRDAATELEIIPFDNNSTKVSADTTSSFFNIYMQGLEPERYYKIILKHTSSTGNVTVYDNDEVFKVIR